MKKLMPSQWIEFQNTIAAMADDSSPREILNTILSWLRRYPEIFSGEPFVAYSFHRFLALKEENYPVETSTMHGKEFEHFKKIIKKYRAKDTESIGMYLRDTLETLVVMEVDEQCSRCGRSGLGVYKSDQDGRIAFECRQCGFAKYVDGSRVSANELTFASVDDLRSVGLILSRPNRRSLIVDDGDFSNGNPILNYKPIKP